MITNRKRPEPQVLTEQALHQALSSLEEALKGASVSDARITLLRKIISEDAQLLKRLGR